MSRSRKKSPAGGITTAESEKGDKQKASRVARRVVREVLAREPDGLLPARREVSNVWTFEKDGKAWYGAGDARWLRK
jgi:hypothetical protein